MVRGREGREEDRQAGRQAMTIEGMAGVVRRLRELRLLTPSSFLSREESSCNLGLFQCLTRGGPIRRFQKPYLCCPLVQTMLLYLIWKLCMSPFIWHIMN